MMEVLNEKHYPRIAATVFGTCWNIIPQTLETMADLVELRIAGGALSRAEIEARVGQQGRARFGKVRGSVAVLPLYGIMAQHAGMMTDISGGTSTDEFGQEFDKLVADPSVGAIVIDVDSGGGSVYGLAELSEKIYAARERKPVVAVANSVMGSAAYYIGSAAGELVATYGAEVGSIGTLAIHVDRSGADTQAGVRRTIIKAGRDKAVGNPFEPLDSEGYSQLQEQVDMYYEMFVQAVAKHRGVTARHVEAEYGQGRMFGAQEALRLGMIDRIATLEQVIQGLQGKKAGSATGAKAVDNYSLHLMAEGDISPADDTSPTESGADDSNEMQSVTIGTAGDSKNITLTIDAKGELQNTADEPEQDEEPEGEEEYQGQPGAKPGRATDVPRRRLRLLTR